MGSRVRFPFPTNGRCLVCGCWWSCAAALSTRARCVDCDKIPPPHTRRCSSFSVACKSICQSEQAGKTYSVFYGQCSCGNFVHPECSTCLSERLCSRRTQDMFVLLMVPWGLVVPWIILYGPYTGLFCDLPRTSSLYLDSIHVVYYMRYNTSCTFICTA